MRREETQRETKHVMMEAETGWSTGEGTPRVSSNTGNGEMLRMNPPLELSETRHLLAPAGTFQDL